MPSAVASGTTLCTGFSAGVRPKKGMPRNDQRKYPATRNAQKPINNVCDTTDSRSKANRFVNTLLNTGSADANSAANTMSTGTASVTPSHARRTFRSRSSCGRACRDNAADQIEGIPLRNRFALQARRGERERPDERERIERGQRRRVPPQEGEAEEQRRDCEPRRVRPVLDLVPANEPGTRADQRRGAQGDVQAPGHRAQQRITDDATHSAGGGNLEPELRAWSEDREHGHTASCVGKPPKRRSRERNSWIAAASCGAPKSGHIRSVNHSSAYAHSHRRKSDNRCSPPVRIRRSTSGRSWPASIAARPE